MTEVSQPAHPRLNNIDIAKGIGIILVVMGHNDFSLVSPLAFKLIYSFHMPLFFFLSGIFFRPSMPFLELVRRRYNSVLKPFFFILLLIFFGGLSFTNVGLLTALSRLGKAMYGSGKYLDWVQLWFLPHLFAVSLYVFLFTWLTGKLRWTWLKALLLLLTLAVGVMNISRFWDWQLKFGPWDFTLYGLPYSLDLVLISGFFFILGYEVFQRVPQGFFKSPLTLLVSAAGLLGMVLVFPDVIDFNIRIYDSLLINTVEALLGITMVLALAWQIDRLGWLSRVFSYVGRNTLPILLFQVPIQEFWGMHINALSNNMNLSYWLSAVAGVVGPLAINRIFIQPNPLVRHWLGMKDEAAQVRRDEVQG